MSILPVIVGFGGIGPAGRSSFHQSYRRTVLESLPSAEGERTIVGLACLMNLVKWDGDRYVNDSGEALGAEQVAIQYRQQVIDGTLIRRFEKNHFDPDKIPVQSSVVLEAAGEHLKFITVQKTLPPILPQSWSVKGLGGGRVEVRIDGSAEGLIKSTRSSPVKGGGQLPTGFDPSAHYNSRFQPRGLQMAIYAASDALHSIGIDWDIVRNSVNPDQIGVYAGSALGQLGSEGLGGLLSNRFKGRRPSAKQLPMGITSMPADFVNAYVLGSVGHTEAITAACASFLFNLRAAVDDIRSGVRRIAFVGNAESPFNPEALEGLAVMGALATEGALCNLDSTDSPDFRRSSRPFGENCGFTAGESSQYIVLMDDKLAVELGAEVHGAVPAAYVNADGVKKSITGPGAGNYISLAKAVATARAILGDEAIQQRSFIQAHGSSTPQNRVTESHIFDKVACAFDIKAWPVVAVKSYVGHSMAAASGDQCINALGVFRYGWLPGIKTMNALADDIHDKRLSIPLQDVNVGEGSMDVAFINAKGFGGNNATGVVLSPQVTENMLAKRYGEDFIRYQQKRAQTRATLKDIEQRIEHCQIAPIYRFGEDMIDEAELTISKDAVHVPGFDNVVKLDFDNDYSDMV
jgi:acetoacetyl-[acyl-carrier protein] synthase